MVKRYSIAVGNVNPFNRKSRQAVKEISKLKGLVGVYPHYPHGTLIFFESLNDAKRGRNVLECKGIKVGNNICEFKEEADGTMEFIGGAE